MRRKRKIKFVGELAHIIGPEAEIAVSDCRDLISWMINCHPKTKRLLRNESPISIGLVNDGCVYHWLSQSDAQQGYIPECESLVVVADINGAGVEIAALVMGVATTSASAIIVGAIINIGISMAINAIIASFAEKPDANKKREDNSYMLNGATNNTRAGCAVPLLFGRWRASTVLISQSVTSERVSVPHPDQIYIDGNPSGTLTTNDYNINGAELDSITYKGVTYTCPCTLLCHDATRGITFNRNGTWSHNIPRVNAIYDIQYTVKSTSAQGFDLSASTDVRFINTYSADAAVDYNGNGIVFDDHYGA